MAGGGNAGQEQVRRLFFAALVFVFAFGYFVNFAHAAEPPSTSTLLFSQPVGTVLSYGSFYSDNWYKLGSGFSGILHTLTMRGMVDDVLYGASNLTLKEFRDPEYATLVRSITISDSAPFTNELATTTLENLSITLKPYFYYRLDTHQLFQNRSVILAGYNTTGTAMWNGRGSAGREEHVYQFSPFMIGLGETATSTVQPPLTLPTNLSFNFDCSNIVLVLSWSSSTDPDWPENRLHYEVNYSTSTPLSDDGWTSAGYDYLSKANLFYRMDVHPGNVYTVGVRARDDFGDISGMTIAVWSFPSDFVPPIAQRDHSQFIGYAGSGAQKITPPVSVSVGAVAMWVGPVDNYLYSQSFIEVHADNNGVPGDLIATSAPSAISRRSDPQEGIYYFNPPFILTAGSSYWLVINQGPSPTSPTAVFGSAGDVYPGGYWSANPSLDAYFRLILAMPAVSDLRQYRSDAASLIPENGTTTENTVVFGALLAGQPLNGLELQVEVKPTNVSFANTPTSVSGFVSNGSFATTSVSGLAPGDYRWQARTADTQGSFSDWQEFGSPGRTDFVVGPLTLPLEQLDYSKALSITGNAQRITLDRTIAISSVKMWLDSPGSPCRGMSFLAVYADESGAPGTLIATSSPTSIYNCYWTPRDTEYEYVFPSPFTLHTGSYWLMPTRADGKDTVIFGSSSDVYDGGYWSGNPSLDAYFRLVTVQPPVRDINVAVILAEPQGTPHSTATTSQPCKLLNQNTAYPGHTKAYYDDLLHCVKNYHLENSYGTVNFNFTVFDNNGSWYHLPRTLADYTPDERELVKDAITSNGLDLSTFDIVAVVRPGSEIESLPTETWSPAYQPLGSPPFKMIVAENDLTGPWAHELGHILGQLVIPSPYSTMVPDLNNMGLTGDLGKILGIKDLRGIEIKSDGHWDLMAEGSHNGSGGNPPYMSSYVKEYLGWLKYDIHPKSDYGLHIISSLDTAKMGDSVFRYNLEDNVSSATARYYILETRNRDLNTWDSSLPEEKALVLYKVNASSSKYGYDLAGNILNQSWVINIPSFPSDGVLTPNGEVYHDLKNDLEITAISDSFSSDTYRINATVEPLAAASFDKVLSGIILGPTLDLWHRAFDLSQPPLFNPLPSTKLSDLSFDARVKLILKLLYYSFITGEMGIVSGGSQISVGVGMPLLLAILLCVFVVSKLGKRYEKMRHFDLLRKELFHPDRKKLMIFVVLAVLYFRFFVNFPLPWHAIPNQCPAGILDDCFAPNEVFFIFNPIFNLLFLYTASCLIVRFAIDRKKTNGVSGRMELFILLVIFVTPLLILFSQSMRTYGRWATLNAPSPGFAAFPDLDLHAYTLDGKHVGMNYQTGQYEMQIPGTEASGGMRGDDEWIFVPASTSVRYVVSSRNNQQFLNANPDIVGQLATTTDSYDIYTRYIDPATGIFTSPTETNQTIAPAQNVVYEVSGTSTPEVSQGVVDNEPPIITHTPLNTEYLLNSTPLSFTFSADDGSGVGVATTTATLDGQPLASGQNISFGVTGPHSIVITATDFLGNAASTTLTYDVVYNFGGFLPPVKPDGSGIYKQGRTLPVKFQLTDSDNQFISTATGHLFTARIQDGIVGTEEVALSTGNNDTGNAFRYDSTDNQYIFNLDTSPLTPGTWQLKVEPDDGTSHAVIVSIRS